MSTMPPTRPVGPPSGLPQGPPQLAAARGTWGTPVPIPPRTGSLWWIIGGGISAVLGAGITLLAIHLLFDSSPREAISATAITGKWTGQCFTDGQAQVTPVTFEFGPSGSYRVTAGQDVTTGTYGLEDDASLSITYLPSGGAPGGKISGHFLAADDKLEIVGLRDPATSSSYSSTSCSVRRDS